MPPESADFLRKCRRSHSCRALLPESDLERNQGGELVCKRGKCPRDLQKESDAILSLELDLRRVKTQLMDAKAGKERALARLERVQSALDVALDINSIDDAGVIAAPEAFDSDEVVTILMLSDDHCGQVVKPSAVNGLNEFNPDIFDDRMDAVFRNSLRVTNTVRASSTVREGIIWLGGDMIEGELHGDAVQNQTLTTTQQIVRCERALVRGFDFMLAHSDLERIIVPCNVGNHGRNTKKQQSNSTENSYEWLMYHSLRRHYRDEPRLVWHIADSDCLYLDVYGKILRFFHGDTVQYNGGAAGPFWNVDKHVKNLDQSILAYHTFHGHFHMLGFGPRATGNGSLPGVAPYGHNKGFRAEVPQQGMRVLHNKRGFIGSFPVFAS